MSASEVDAVEVAASHGEKMPGALNYFDQLRYHGLYYIYLNYRLGKVDKTTASEYKKHLIAEIEHLKEGFEFAIKCWNSAAERYKAMERSISAYRLNPCRETADKLADAWDGLKKFTE